MELERSEDLTKQLDHAFEHDEKLTVATKRQQEIVNALDITKNQASAKVADSPEENGEAVEEKFDQVNAVKAVLKNTRPVKLSV